MNADEILPANTLSVIAAQKADIFSTFHCIQIGKIEKVTKAEQTVEVTLQIKRLASDGTSAAIPLLVDVPFMVLQGGGSYIDLPIAVGDYCIVLFNDRDIDTWWSTANMADPATTRKHDLSDGIAIVGLNPKTKVRTRDGVKARVVSDENIALETEKQIELKSTAETKVTASKVELNGNTKTFVTHAELTIALSAFLVTLNAHVHNYNVLGVPTPVTPPVTPMTLDISSAATTTIKTGG
jgi:hypothetical protein